MKITCTQSDLSKGLATAGHVLSGRSTLPILTCVHLVAASDCLTLYATNLEMGISYDFAATVEEPGAIALPARLLSEFVNSLPAGNVTIIVPDGETTALVSGLRSRAHIRGMDPQEYPNLATSQDDTLYYCFEAQQLKEAITQVAFAAANDDSRPSSQRCFCRAMMIMSPSQRLLPFAWQNARGLWQPRSRGKSL